MRAVGQRVLLVICLSTLIAVASASSDGSSRGPNAGGVLIVHDLGQAYTWDQGSYCSEDFENPDLPSCDLADTRLESYIAEDDTIWTWKVYAAFPDGVFPRLKAVTFGIDYPTPDQGAAFYVTASGLCGDLEVTAPSGQGEDWPASGSGVGVTFDIVRETQIVEVYWFAGYNYYQDERYFAVTEHPTQGATFADDSVPPVIDEIVDFGILGINQDGYLPCPSPYGACCLEDGSCVFLQQIDCEAQIGYWMDGVTCDPNPCPPSEYYIHVDQVVWDGMEGAITVGMINSSPLLGYSIHLNYAPEAFEVIGLSLEGTVAEGAEYFAAAYTDSTVSAGVVFSYACPPSILPGDWTALRILVRGKEGAAEGQYSFDFNDSPPALNRMAACDGGTVIPLLTDGEVELRWRRFVRGDITADGSVDISDPIFSLSHQFVAGPAPLCSESEDINDSGEVNISDPIHLLAYMFAGGEPPALPFPDCGIDPTGFDLGCDCFPPCEYWCDSNSKDMDSGAVRMELVEGGRLHLEVLVSAGSDTLWAFLEGDLLGELSALEAALSFSGEELEFAGFQPSPALSACDFVESAEWAGDSRGGLPWSRNDSAQYGEEVASDASLDQSSPHGGADTSSLANADGAALVRLGVIADFTMTEVIGPGPLRIGRFGFVRRQSPSNDTAGIHLLDGLGVTPDLDELLLTAETTQPSGVPEGGRSTEALDSAPSFRLSNPYRPGSSIQLRLGAPDGPIKVDLYDVQGRRVARLFEGPVTASTLDLVWDGTGAEGTSVSSGVYLLKATGPGLSLTRRLIVVK